MAEPLLITTRSLRAAECIARELEAFESALSEGIGETWTVTVLRSAQLSEVLNALQACLGENGIDAVSIVVDGRKYMMEPALL